MRPLLALALIASCSGKHATEAECARAGETAARLMDSGFKDQEKVVAGQLAKVCSDAKHPWTSAQATCVANAKTNADLKSCDD